MLPINEATNEATHANYFHKNDNTYDSNRTFSVESSRLESVKPTPQFAPEK